MLIEQFISGFNDNDMINEILKEVATLEDTEGTISECMMLWTLSVEAQRAQKSILNYIKEAKEFDVIKHSSQKPEYAAARVQKKVNICKYCGRDTH